VPIADWWSWLSAATPFSELGDTDRAELVAHMLAAQILFESGGRYTLGARGAKLYGWRNFNELYAVFSAPQTLRVLFGSQEIGSIDAQFAQQQSPHALSFVLAARPGGRSRSTGRTRSFAFNRSPRAGCCAGRGHLSSSGATW